MRISNPMLTRNYLKRMNTNLTHLTGSNEKMASGRAYSKGYENVSDAGKALKMRKMIDDNERYSVTIRDVEGRIASAEDGIRTTVTLMNRLTDRTVEGLNGTMAPEDRQKIAIEIDRMQEEVFQIMNSKFSDKYVFDAAGSADGKAPFQLVNGELAYNGTRVDDIERNPATGRPGYEYPAASGVIVDIPNNAHNYVDIGFGYEIVGGKVDYNTAFQETFSGVECFGYGKNADGMSINAYNLLGEISQAFKNGDMAKAEKGLDAIGDSMNFMLTSVTEIGARSVLLEDTALRLDNQLIGLLENQNRLEGVDLSREAIFNKEFEMSWMVTLQLGSKILPQTIFDFLR